MMVWSVLERVHGGALVDDAGGGTGDRARPSRAVAMDAGRLGSSSEGEANGRTRRLAGPAGGTAESVQPEVRERLAGTRDGGDAVDAERLGQACV